jgi:hypothetical protein
VVATRAQSEARLLPKTLTIEPRVARLLTRTSTRLDGPMIAPRRVAQYHLGEDGRQTLWSSAVRSSSPEGTALAFRKLPTSPTDTLRTLR